MMQRMILKGTTLVKVFLIFNFFSKSLNIFCYTRLNPWDFYGNVTKYLYEVGKLLMTFQAIGTHL